MAALNSPQDPPQDFAVVASAGWFDGQALRSRQATTFTVRQGVITDIDTGDHGTAMQAQGLTVHRAGFVLPGLVDAHVHLFLDGSSTDVAVRSAYLKQPVQDLTAAARHHARKTWARGVTRVRDAGDRYGINNLIREEALQHPGELPQVRSGGLGVKRARRYGAFMATDVSDADSIRASVHRLAETNDEIKLILTGIIDFDAGAVTDEPQFDVEAATQVVQAARECGRKVFAHCSGEQGLRVAVEAGIASIEHGFFMPQDLLAKMRDQQTAWTPTFCPVHFQWAHPGHAGWSANTVGHLRRILDQHAERVLQAQRLGVPLLLGTDAGSMGVDHGTAVFEEMTRYLEAGLTLEATLQAATANARRYFGLAHPTLRPGAPFEAVLLDGSPWDAVAALQSVRQVRGANPLDGH